MKGALPWLPAWLTATPIQIAIALNSLIAALVIAAVAAHLHGRRELYVNEVQAKVASMARAQAVQIGDHMRNYALLLGQLETRLQVDRILNSAAKPVKSPGDLHPDGAKVQELLRQFQDLVPLSVDLWMLGADQRLDAASDFLNSHSLITHFCPAMLQYRLGDAANRLQVFSDTGGGHCPPPGTLIVEKRISTLGQSRGATLWLLVGPEVLETSLLQDLPLLPAPYQYRVIGAGNKILRASAHTDPASAALQFPVALDGMASGGELVWQDPVNGQNNAGVRANVMGTDMQVQVVYSAQQAIAPQWGPYARLWIGVASLFLLIWWSVSYLVIQLIRRHQWTLMVNEQRFATSLDYAAVGVWEWNVASDTVFWSGRVAPMLGFKNADQHLTWPEFMSLMHPQDRHQFESAMQQCLTDWIPLVQSFRIEDGACTLRWLQATGNALRDRHGVAVKVMGVLQDISERVASENRLRELNETLELRVHERTQALTASLESAEQAKRSRGEFLAKMSHEIRTPMNAVLGMAYLALRTQPAPKLKKYLDKIRSSGEHLLRIINDILDFSKIDAGKLELELTNFDLDHVLDNVVQLCEGRAIEKGLRLRMEVDDSMPRSLCGDSLRLEQVLINYVHNAVKFTDHGGIVVRVQKADDPAEGLGNCKLRFEVEDTGIGLSPAQIPRLFASFEQLDNSTTRKFGGTGLGLAICSQLARLMGGEVGVTSQLGVGSIFWFTARLQIADDPDSVISNHQTQQEVRASLRGKRVLVVDDNELNLEVAQEILDSAGMHVDTATNGVQALAALQLKKFDCVLMDMHMPVMDGMEATRRIRADASHGKLPVIAVTANARHEDHTECFAAGMNAVVIKPFVPDKLFGVIAEWLLATQASEPWDRLGIVDIPLIDNAEGIENDDVADFSAIAVWDAAVLPRFVGNDGTVQRRLIEKFQRATPDLLDSMQRDQMANDWLAVSATAHKLKSSARTIGALRLGAVCEGLEQAGKSTDVPKCRSLLGRVETVRADTQAHISAWLQQTQT
ncbi:MAG: response regulator [Rhodoferax sp.]|nr:response regulator [Rhodoferax sp.]